MSVENTVQDYQNKDRFGNFLAKISVVHIVIFGVLILIVVAMSKGGTDSRYNYIIYGVLITTILVLYFKPSAKNKIIPEHIAKELAQRTLDFKRSMGEEISFDSTVKVMPQCQLIWKDDLISGDSHPISWDIGFKEWVNGSRYTKEGIISLNPYTGEVTGLCWMPLGYSGKEKATHIKIVPVGVIGNSPGSNLNPKDFKQ